MLSCFDKIPRHITDERTDGQTDGRTCDSIVRAIIIAVKRFKFGPKLDLLFSKEKLQILV